MTQASQTYETSVTKGQSTSIADTVTWNEWEEVSQAVETPLESLNELLNKSVDSPSYTEVTSPVSVDMVSAITKPVELGFQLDTVVQQRIQTQHMLRDTSGKEIANQLSQIRRYTQDLS